VRWGNERSIEKTGAILNRPAKRPISNKNRRDFFMINWKVRIKNKNFWLALIPALLLLIQAVAYVFGFSLDLSEMGDKLLAVVNALFAVLAILGVVTDPTTAGLGDSDLAMTYDEPRED